ncbi:hypothetical protein ACSLNT_29470, partial [Escherichia coli]
ESGTEQCWKNWASGKKDKTTNKHKKIPTSDVYVIYLVTSERHVFSSACKHPARDCMGFLYGHLWDLMHNKLMSFLINLKWLV